MKFFMLLFVVICFTHQEEIKNIEDIEFDPLFTVVKKNKKKLQKNSTPQKQKNLVTSQAFSKPPKRNLQVFQTDENGKFTNNFTQKFVSENHKPFNRNLANQSSQKIQRKNLQDFQRLLTLAQQFKTDPYFKVKVSVKYHPEKQLQTQQTQPVKRKLRQIKVNEKVEKKTTLRSKMKIPNNFYL